MIKRITAILLTLFMLLPLIACSETTESGANETTAAASEVTSGDEEVETADPAYTHGVAEADWEGKTFTIVYPAWSLYNKYLTTEEYNGAVMNDAIYDRTMAIEEYLGCKLAWYSPGYIETIEPTIKTAVTAGDESYQLALTHCYSGVSGLITENLVRNWKNIPNVDLTKSYWNQYVVNEMELAGALPMASGEFILADVNSIFFSQTLIDEYGLENPYNLVYDGKWTNDKMIEMSAAATRDINGDSKMTKDDQYGFAMENGWQMCSFQAASDIFSISVNDEKTLEYTLFSDKMVNLVETISSFVNDSGYAYTWAYSSSVDPNNGGTPPTLFLDGQALFFCVPLSYAEAFRDTEISFGILPFPKYDESQEEYLSFNWAGYMCVPQTAGDMEFVGSVSELLQYYNYELVRPAFFENLLDQKIALDPESTDMLEIIFDNTVYDIGLMFNMSLYWFNTSLGQASNFASYYEKQIKSQTKLLEKTWEKIEGYAELNP